VPLADTRGDAPGLDAAAATLETAVSAGLLPSAVLEIGSTARMRGRIAIGAPSDAIYDLASLTKVLGTGLAATHLLGARRLALDQPVEAIVDAWRGADRATVTVRDLLAHASGLPAHLPLFERHTGEALIGASACAPLEHAPRTSATYSDLGFIVLGQVLALVSGKGLGELVHELLRGLVDDPPRYSGTWPGRAVQPTGISAWRQRLLHGEVHDDNATAMGGVAGHAGLFGSAGAVGGVARMVLRALRGEATPLGPSWAVRASVRRSPVPGSSRALAWDTALPSSSCGSAWSASGVGHTGFTGTSLWIDPARDLYVVLLTNRVAGRATAADIARLRRDVHDAIALAWIAAR
jgi:serine-type D-Ala-D-Ala carboxypeptidase